MKLTTTGLPDDCAALSKVGRDAGRRRLGHEDNHLGLRIPREQVQRLQRGDRADVSLQIATACAECLRDALTQLVNGAGDRLQSRARGGDDADPAAADPVGKAQPNTVDDRRAAVRTHHQQAFVARLALERDLVRQVDVVAVEEDVLAEVERLPRHARGVRGPAP